MPVKNGLYYEIHGSGPELVLLHGNGEDCRIFDVLIERLEKDFRLILIDSPGHGASHPLTTYSYKSMAHEILALLSSLIEEKALVLGYSDGGIIALYLGLLMPEKLRGLIMCGINLEPEGVEPEILEEMKASYRLNHSPLTALMLKEPHFNEAELSELKLPSLILFGEFDLISRAHIDEIRRHLPEAEVRIVPGEDHGSYICGSSKLEPFVREMMQKLS